GGKVGVSTDGKVIATGSYQDHRARLWDGRTGKERLTWHGHLDDVRGVAWSPDGRQVATACPADGTFRLWDAATGTPGLQAQLLGSHDVFSGGCGPTTFRFSLDARPAPACLDGRRGQPAAPRSLLRRRLESGSRGAWPADPGRHGARATPAFPVGPRFRRGGQERGLLARRPHAGRRLPRQAGVSF